MVLKNTPIKSWKNVIPQLFTLLNHKELFVRQIICNLLTRIAKEYPNLVVFPAVVGNENDPSKFEIINNSYTNHNQNKIIKKKLYFK